MYAKLISKFFLLHCILHITKIKRLKKNIGQQLGQIDQQFNRSFEKKYYIFTN